MHRIHTALVQKRGEKSVIEEEIENFHVSISAVSASSVNVPLKAVPTSLLTSPSKPFSYQSVLGHSHMRPMNTSPPYLQQQMSTTPMYHAPPAYTHVNMTHQYSQQPESTAGVQQGHAPVNMTHQYVQQPESTAGVQGHAPVNAPVNNSYSQPSQPPAAQVMSAPEQVQSAQQQGHAPVKAKSNPTKQQEQVAATAPAAVEPEKESEEEIRQKEMKEEQQRLVAEMKRLKEEEDQKKLKAAREKEKAQGTHSLT
jgi:hypothetical protein